MRRAHPSSSLGTRLGAFLIVSTLAIAPWLVAGRPARAADAADRAAAHDAVAWLVTQQQPDGGFEVAGFPGFETRDAVLAIAEAAQTGSSWSAKDARKAVKDVVTNGHSPLDALDALAKTPGLGAGGAAKLIMLAAAPLGYQATSFDPVETGVPIDLLGIVVAGAAPDGSYGFFTDTLYAALARGLVLGTVPASTLAYVRAAQQTNGSWNFLGDPNGQDLDPDTTALAIEVLAAAGANPANDADLRDALRFLATEQGNDGSWKSPFDDGNPSSTALAAIAVVASGYDPGTSCWRDTFAPTRVGSSYASPAAYLRSKQGSDGHIESPFDSFGVNTLGTAQAVEGLLATWLPMARAPRQSCTDPTTTTTTTTTAPTTPTSVAGISVRLLPATGASTSQVVMTLLGVGLVVVGACCLRLGRDRRLRDRSTLR